MGGGVGAYVGKMRDGKFANSEIRVATHENE